ncbi:NrtR DNA-binding winged helix domain-containing protein [Asticcacaulis sp. 201]|uniref:NUDIX hydrolase n=1 Tax=Asticcacaulis sp. 201 TaxID=3028787 RepID=UPI0029167E4D|nr:NAD regulator [Asticcacaulis sp. 201]MDV6329574.1 NAD regulator [Asticcacaulis sp. 201]
MSLAIELSAVVVTVKDNEALVLCLNLPRGEAAFALPSGPFIPENHRTFDLALRAFVREQTGFDIGYVEQLYSFGDDGRQGIAASAPDGDRVVSVGYLALTPQAVQARFDAAWVPFNRFFPWEDWRHGDSNPDLEALRPALRDWCDTAATGTEHALRLRRVETLFPDDFDNWNEERVLDRYELLYSVGLTGEAQRTRDGGPAAPSSGESMASDHRRILATGLSRLRGKLKYRPVIFELMPEQFTLLELQKSLEALSGLRLHKQNFRRALDRTGFVTPLGIMREDTGGRPAELYSYNRDQFHFSPSLGLSLPRA